MKYWIANINEQNGEFEYKQAIVFKAETEAKANYTHEFHVSTWYGDDHMKWDKNNNCYWNDHVAVTQGCMTEIDKHTFEQMLKHGMPDMSKIMRDMQMQKLGMRDMSKHEMQKWATVYTAVDADGNTEMHDDGSPVLYFRKQDEDAPYCECHAKFEDCGYQDFCR